MANISMNLWIQKKNICLIHNHDKDSDEEKGFDDEHQDFILGTKLKYLMFYQIFCTFCCSFFHVSSLSSPNNQILVEMEGI